MPGSLADQINQDRSVISKKTRQKQKRPRDDEEDSEHVCFSRDRLSWTNRSLRFSRDD